VGAAAAASDGAERHAAVGADGHGGAETVNVRRRGIFKFW
jgi:hypothetical protein